MGWELTGKIHGDAALWENPDNGLGTGCSNWTVLEDCVGYSGDFMFALRGVVKGAVTAKEKHFMTGATGNPGSS
ncbi:MAG TPA: hypothetical protein VHY79_14735 [Rhizomicrobium sp.]|jgi:hypothetical protein|nr:hypothetical protein [Rhizomicrobium sp.]